ncbi:sigma-54 interaction domain-containing protein [Desulfosediminicola flagellatus]|uniref:sigma-54 interaction domain-containing protein n=1 Tax=Desulfosediminicola flagellatus TaxID=2569541 RepID=UPI0010ABC7A6|nr:sigma 54-interacting transcriptional regulator [Desulfosediminicola flagellatus]
MIEIKQDIDRLLHNQRNLLDVMQEMVLLVHGGDKIEYMNPSAISFFGDIRNNHKKINADKNKNPASELFSIIHRAIEQDMVGVHKEITINDAFLEFILAPFEGYKGDRLHWLFLRDITRTKSNIESIHDFQNSMESILNDEINELKDRDRVRESLASEKNYLNDKFNNFFEEGTMVGSSKSLRQLREMVRRVAKSDATILITGESGTGKELVANMIRESSDRNRKPFLKINCNTINDSILESDLFGYEKGAFTGADSQRHGKFEVVDGGTIFLDEIGDISPRMQAALLRVLQDGEIIRVGGNTPIQIDVRIIAATNNDLPKAVQDGSFRLDLFYRLNIINISIPPLRSRKEDIIDLVSHFIRRYRRAFKKDINFLPQSVIDRLIKHDWPGNVRELENVIQRSILMSKSNVITENDLFFDNPLEKINSTDEISYLHRLDGMPLKNMLAEVEREIISYALAKNKGNVATTAEQLKIGKTAFYDKMKRYDISPKEHK